MYRGSAMMRLGGLMVMVVSAILAAGTAMCDKNIDRLYVATNGRDNWSGRLAAPNNAGTDGPLATLDGAKKTVRKIKKQNGGSTHPINIYLREGTYFLDKTFELTPQDSGTPDCPITYEAYKGAKGVEKVVISGGEPIAGFQPTKVNGHDMIVADVPSLKDLERYPDQLFVNSRRADRTRLPKTGWYKVKSAPITDKWQEGQDTFTFDNNDLNPSWKNLGDVDIVALTLWVEARMRIKSIDPSSKTISLNKRSTYRLLREHDHNRGADYYVENVFEALDTPGQWYLDRSVGKLYYYPLPGEDWQKAEFVTSDLERLVNLKGNAKAPVEYVKFQNLHFGHTMYVLPPDRAGSGQAAVDVPGAVNLSYCRNCEIDHCDISHIGTYAVELTKGCANCVVHCNSITDMGAGGIKIGHGTESTTVSDNEIRDGGKIFASAIGVWIGNSPHNRVIHNTIADLYYTGVSVGWSWGYGKSKAFDNIIDSNHIFNIGRGALCDLGGIYTLGISPGTILRGNLIHDCQSFGYGGWGIYTDEGSSGILIENNIIYRTKTGGFHQHYGKENTLTNNIFAFAKEQQLQRTLAEEHTSFTFERNIVYYDSGELLGINWSEDRYVMDYNVYFDTSGRPITFEGASFEDWKKRGHDEHSIIADPVFIDPQKGNFQVKPNSPALKLGFKQIDMSVVGPREKVGVSR